MKKTAIITGASSGMGREMVYELADRFRSIEEIWVIARREDRLLELKDKVTADICDPLSFFTIIKVMLVPKGLLPP